MLTKCSRDEERRVDALNFELFPKINILNAIGMDSEVAAL